MRFIIVFSFFLFGCSIFPKQEILLAKHQKLNGEELGIYHVSMGATTNDVIQVRRVNQNKILWVSENYNCLKHSILISDSILQLVLTDTGFNNYSNVIDTINVSVK
jgi:hypothetical protein